MRVIDRSRGVRASRLARYVQMEKRKAAGPLGALRRAPHEASPSRLARFLRIARGHTA